MFFTDCKNASAPVIIKSLNHSGNIKQISCNAEAPFSITKISLLLAVSFSFWTFFGCESKMSQANRTQSWPIIIAYNDNRHKFSYLCFIFCWFYMSTHTRTYFLAQVSQQRSRLVCLLLLLVYLKRTENTICLFAKKKNTKQPYKLMCCLFRRTLFSIVNKSPPIHFYLNNLPRHFHISAQS